MSAKSPGKTDKKIGDRPNKTAVLVVDVLNDLEFPGGENVLPWAEKMVSKLAAVLNRARASDIPVIYANDNFGHWRSSLNDVYNEATRDGARGRSIARALKPALSDLFVLKPKHSAFFATSLVPLLEHLGTEHLILAGIATNLCVLFTANDAHMHEYELTVLSDCCAAESDHDHDHALDQLQRFLGVRVCRGDEVELGTRGTLDHQ